VQTFVMEDLNRRHHWVRRSYDTVAEEYAGGFRDELAGKPLDRALLACLAEQAEQGTAIVDLGCGPGHVAAWLAGRGVAAVGIDLSPRMIAAGRRDYPEVEFREGDFLALPAAVSLGPPSLSTRSSILSRESWAGRSGRSTGCCGLRAFSSSHFMWARR
jgi:SAM-dependent methyltransferase